MDPITLGFILIFSWFWPAVLMYPLAFAFYKYVIQPGEGLGRLIALLLVIFIGATLLLAKFLPITIDMRPRIHTIVNYSYLFLSGMLLAHFRYMLKMKWWLIVLLMIVAVLIGACQMMAIGMLSQR